MNETQDEHTEKCDERQDERQIQQLFSINVMQSW